MSGKSTTTKLGGTRDTRSLRDSVTVTKKSLETAPPPKIHRAQAGQEVAARERSPLVANQEFDEMYLHVARELTDDGTLYQKVKGDKKVIANLIKDGVVRQNTLFSAEYHPDEVTNYLFQSYFKEIAGNLDVIQEYPVGIIKKKFPLRTKDDFVYILDNLEEAAASFYKSYSVSKDMHSLTFSSYLQFFKLSLCDLMFTKLESKVTGKLVERYHLGAVYDVARTKKEVEKIVSSFIERIDSHDDDEYDERKHLARGVFNMFPSYATKNADYYRAYVAAMK